MGCMAVGNRLRHEWGFIRSTTKQKETSAYKGRQKAVSAEDEKRWWQTRRPPATHMLKYEPHREVGRTNTIWMYLLRFQPAHILPELIVRAVFRVRHQVDPALALVPYWKGLALHLIHPACGNKADHLQAPQAMFYLLQMQGDG